MSSRPRIWPCYWRANSIPDLSLAVSGTTGILVECDTRAVSLRQCKMGRLIRRRHRRISALKDERGKLSNVRDLGKIHSTADFGLIARGLSLAGSIA